MDEEPKEIELKFEPAPDNFHSCIQQQISFIDWYVAFRDNSEFYAKFEEDLIKATIRAFKQISLLQDAITEQVNAQKQAYVDVNSD